jgi:signal transduction histidine kinase
MYQCFTQAGDSKMNIMVTDDEGIVIESLQRGLRRFGHSVIGALSGEEALKKLNNGGPKIDLVITDYAMPGMNGLDLVRKIRDKSRSLPIIMMTAYGDKHLVIEALKNHCDGFIEKPFSLHNLVEEIRLIENQSRRNSEQCDHPQLFAKFVHQINNPLNCIMGNAEMALLKSNQAQDIKELLSEIISSAERIENINHQIIKMDQAPETLREAVDIKILLETCLKEFEGLLFLKAITLTKEFDDGALSVSGSPFDLEQVIKNVILNAIQAMEQSAEKRLTVRAEKINEGSVVAVNVSDSGCGMPEARLADIFTPYYTTKANGSGLGLAIVKNTLEKNQGTISVTSREGRGTTFTLIFQAAA